MVDAAVRYTPFDALTVFEEALTTAVTANLANILTVGDGRIDAIAVLDITALDIVTTDETYNVYIQGSSSATFASDIENLAAYDLADTASRDGGADVTSLIGRHEIHFSNSMNGVEYKYIRARIVIAGTTPSITLTAWVSMRTE